MAYIIVEVDDQDADLLERISSIMITSENGRGSEALAVAVARRIGVTGEVIDHIDRYPPNNKRKNLRAATKGQNRANSGVQRNKSTNPYKGVVRDSREFKKGRLVYYARIKMNENIRVGLVRNTPEEAARDYDVMALENWGEFAYTNFPKENYG